MKKAMVYVIALTLALSALLAGCGETRRTDGEATAPTATPQQTMVPESMMPNPEDGIVRDGDGIITDGDTGGTGGAAPTAPNTGANPVTGSGTTPGGSVMQKSSVYGKR